MIAPDEDTAPPARLRDVPAILRGHGRRIAVAAGLALAGTVLGLVQPLIAMRLVDAAATGPIGWSAPAMLAGLFLAQSAVQAYARYALVRVGEGIMLGVRQRLVSHLLRLPIPVYERYRTGDLISRVGHDTTVLRNLVAESSVDAVVGVLALAATVALMAWLDWTLLLIVAVLVGVGVAVLLVVLRGIARASRGAQEATGAMTADLERAMAAIRTVRNSRAERRESARIDDRARSAYRANLRVARLDAGVGPASQLAVNGSFLIIVLIGGARVAAGSATVGELVAFALYLTYVTAPVGAIFQAVSAARQGAGALHRINEITALPAETDDGSAAPRVPSAPASYPATDRSPLLELDNVWFGYNPGQPVLRGLSLRVPAKGHVALVGPSGAGKSTIFELIQRFYEPDRGHLRFAGRPVRSLDHADLRSHIGLVEQHSPALYGTVRDNLTYTATDASDADIHRVLRLTNLDGLIARLPRGLDTDVGEHGNRLSGGERQRLAIARCLLARPRLILLDEPTAHLDAGNEAALTQTLRQLSRTCALLVIAHRYSTVRAADHVIVIEHGQASAVGDHAQLLATNRYYQHLAADWLNDMAPEEANGAAAHPR